MSAPSYFALASLIDGPLLSWPSIGALAAILATALVDAERLAGVAALAPRQL